MLSAIIIVKNHEDLIEECLNHLTWVDEIIVVDNNSTDETIPRAKKLGAQIVKSDELNFADVRNVGAQKAQGDWLLYVDTDEEIPLVLQKEIQHIVSSLPTDTSPQAYVIPRKNYFLGKPWPMNDGMVRLIFKPSLKEWYGALHETAKINGLVSTLEHTMIHRTHRSLSEMVAKTNQWSDIEADLRLKHNHPPVVAWRLLRVMVTGFFDFYGKQGGWKVGTVGIIESSYQGFSLFITYAKLWEKQHHTLDRHT